MRSDPDRIQCGSVGLSAAFWYLDQDLQQHWALESVDHCVTAGLWLQSWSSTEECLMKTVLKDGVWHGT